MNKIYSLFLLVIVLCLGCSSDDNGTNPNNPNFPGSGNNSIVWDDWYWEFTIDTITYRCEGFYPKSVASDDYDGQIEAENWFYNDPNHFIQNDLNTNFVMNLADRSYPSWVSGDESEINFDIINSPPQTSQTDAFIYVPSNSPNYTYGNTYGQSIEQYIIDAFYNGDNTADILANTSPNASGSDLYNVNNTGYSIDTISMLYTPGNFYWTGSWGYSSEPSIGESNFTFYFYQDDPTNSSYIQVGSADCSLRFKAPSIWEYW